MNNQLTVIINENQIEPEQANILKVKFTDLIDQAQALSSQADTIKVKDETDVESMQEARTLRLKLKGIRTDTENSRKALKEGIIRAGKAIDGVSNIIKALTTPAEEYLETQEKYAELAKEKAIQTRYETRRDTLSQYVDDVTLYAIKDMPDEVFESLLAGAKQRNEDIKKAEQAAREMEEQRKKEQEIENERIRKENAELKLKAEADSKKQAEEQAKRDEQEKKARTEQKK